MSDEAGFTPTDPPITDPPPAAEAPPTLDQVHDILNSVIHDVVVSVTAQTAYLQKLLDAEAKQRGIDAPVAQVAEEWVRKQVEAAFSSGKIAELKAKLAHLLVTQHGPTRRNPVALA